MKMTTRHIPIEYRRRAIELFSEKTGCSMPVFDTYFDATNDLYFYTRDNEIVLCNSNWFELCGRDEVIVEFKVAAYINGDLHNE